MKSHNTIFLKSLFLGFFLTLLTACAAGDLYDFGFLLGVIFIWGGGSHRSCRSFADKKFDKEWEEIGNKVELKVMRKLQDWAEDEEETGSDKEWEEIGEKVEKKLKRKIREWAEKD